MLTNDITIDELTGVYNKSFMFEILEKLIDLEKNDNGQLGIIIAELFDLKGINDLYGFNVGSKVIQQTAMLIQRNIRPTDILARYNANAFGIILPHTDKTKVFEQAEIIEKSINRNVVNNIPLKKNITVKTRIGISIFPDHATEPCSLIEAATKSLSQAKNERNSTSVLFNGEFDRLNKVSL
ncbi:MAG: GGDEF domain-containing protein [Planctomycetes bacterium]|nr:GGDEF domain-containing protein [Planctomycetota bacterium]